MKPKPSPARLAAALLIGAAAISATPLCAQETPAQTTQDIAPPPVVTTVTPAPAPAPAPAPVQAAPSPTFAPAAPVVQSIPESSLPPTAAAPSSTRRASQAVTRTTRSTASTSTTRSAAPVRPAPAPAAPAQPAPQATTPLPAPQQADEQAQAPEPASQATTTTTTTTRAPVWPWVVGAIVLLALLIGGALAMRGRRETVVDDRVPLREEESLAVLSVPEPATAIGDDTHLTPLPVAEAVVETPTAMEAAEASAVEAREHAVVQETEAAELAGIVDAAAPVDHRPWLEFGIRPVRAGTSHKDALVEVELIVGNSGDVAAENVHISTFMLPAGAGTDMDRLLAHQHEDSVPPVTIEPGEGTKVDAVMSVPREELNGDASFQPVIVADARYTLADGREGRTSAAFRIGLTDDKGERFEPIGIEHPDIFHNVAAQLHGTPEHV